MNGLGTMPGTRGTERVSSSASESRNRVSRTALRRENPPTLGLLADPLEETDFSSCRRVEVPRISTSGAMRGAIHRRKRLPVPLEPRSRLPSDFWREGRGADWDSRRFPGWERRFSENRGLCPVGGRGFSGILEVFPGWGRRFFGFFRLSDLSRGHFLEGCLEIFQGPGVAALGPATPLFK